MNSRTNGEFSSARAMVKTLCSFAAAQCGKALPYLEEIFRLFGGCASDSIAKPRNLKTKARLTHQVNRASVLVLSEPKKANGC
jgi:hypothetical protein